MSARCCGVNKEQQEEKQDSDHHVALCVGAGSNGVEWVETSIVMLLIDSDRYPLHSTTTRECSVPPQARRFEVRPITKMNEPGLKTLTEEIIRISCLQAVEKTID